MRTCSTGRQMLVELRANGAYVMPYRGLGVHAVAVAANRARSKSLVIYIYRIQFLVPLQSTCS